MRTGREHQPNRARARPGLSLLVRSLRLPGLSCPRWPTHASLSHLGSRMVRRFVHTLHALRTLVASLDQDRRNDRKQGVLSPRRCARSHPPELSYRDHMGTTPEVVESRRDLVEPHCIGRGSSCVCEEFARRSKRAVLGRRWFDPRCAHDRQTRMVKPCGARVCEKLAKRRPNLSSELDRGAPGKPSRSMAPDRGQPPSAWQAEALAALTRRDRQRVRMADGCTTDNAWPNGGQIERGKSGVERVRVRATCRQNAC